MFVWEKLQRPGRYLSHSKLENDIMNKRGSYFQLIAPNTSFTQFEPSFGRLGTPGLWWILRQCCTTNTKTKGEMKRRSCGTPVVPVLIVKPATATVRLTALIPVLCPHQVRRRSMRWVTEITLSIRCARSLNSASALWYLTYLTWCVSHYTHIFAKCSKLLISQRSLCTNLLKKHVFWAFLFPIQNHLKNLKWSSYCTLFIQSFVKISSVFLFLFLNSQLEWLSIS